MHRENNNVVSWSADSLSAMYLLNTDVKHVQRKLVSLILGIDYVIGGASVFTATGLDLAHTNGGVNTTTTVTDIAGRSISVTDAAGNVTTTAYCPCCDQPATVTDALGNTTHYRYDIRGRKVAEWGTSNEI